MPKHVTVKSHISAIYKMQVIHFNAVSGALSVSVSVYLYDIYDTDILFNLWDLNDVTYSLVLNACLDESHSKYSLVILRNAVLDNTISIDA